MLEIPSIVHTILSTYTHMHYSLVLHLNSYTMAVFNVFTQTQEGRYTNTHIRHTQNNNSHHLYLLLVKYW